MIPGNPGRRPENRWNCRAGKNLDVHEPENIMSFHATSILRVACLVPVHGRQFVVRHCLETMKAEQRKTIGITFHNIAVTSLPEDSQFCQALGFNVVETENRPLGRKMNTGLYYAMQNFDFDYLFILGSDDILRIGFFDNFRPYFARQMDFFGINQIYVVNAMSGRLIRFFYGDGCGLRFMSRQLLEQVTQAWELWPNELNKGLDYAAMERIKETRPDVRQKFVIGPPLAVDVKGQNNIHSFASLAGSKQARQPAETKGDILQAFPALATWLK